MRGDILGYLLFFILRFLNFHWFFVFPGLIYWWGYSLYSYSFHSKLEWPLWVNCWDFIHYFLSIEIIFHPHWPSDFTHLYKQHRIKSWYSNDIQKFFDLKFWSSFSYLIQCYLIMRNKPFLFLNKHFLRISFLIQTQISIECWVITRIGFIVILFDQGLISDWSLICLKNH